MDRWKEDTGVDIGMVNDWMEDGKWLNEGMVNDWMWVGINMGWWYRNIGAWWQGACLAPLLCTSWSCPALVHSYPCHLLPRGCPTDVVEHRRWLREGHPLLHFHDELYAVQVHVFITVLLNQIGLPSNKGTLWMDSGISTSGWPISSEAPRRKGRKW